jgi:hypothetical protein
MNTVTERQVTLLYKIDDPQIISRLWDIYKKAFSGQEFRNPQNQCFFADIESFQEAMEDTDWQKYIAYNNNQTAGLLLVTTNLEKARIGYINPECFEMAAPLYKGKIFYVAVMFILKEFQNSACFWNLFQSYFEQVSASGGVAAFDVNGTLMPDFYKAATTLLKAVNFPAIPKKLGQQEYWIIIPDKK